MRLIPVRRELSHNLLVLTIRLTRITPASMIPAKLSVSPETGYEDGKLKAMREQIQSCWLDMKEQGP